MVATSDSVRRGTRHTVRIHDRELVVFRGHDGGVGLLDAHCPHLGAHLGDGRVVGNAIECPFHRWQFGTDATCTAIPYASRIPRVRARCHPVREWNGMILAHLHPSDAAPSIELPDLALGRRTWVRRSIDIRAPIYEIAENPADVGHFFAVHGYLEPPAIDYCFDGPISSFDQQQRLRVLGRAVPIRIRATSYGPGVSVLHIEQVVDTVVLLNPVPIEHALTRVHFAVGVSGNPLRSFVPAQFAAWQLGRELRVDRRIWERKIHLARPALCDGDGPIMKFRRWYRQFYTAT
ncbi:MAG TPA: Rieske 2Fe-2S domain-containing protein [Nannocystaceae bacterium]|nr:Rieske 2Fe-2S domain-containing protein [Nannocystaceae bacterium]